MSTPPNAAAIDPQIKAYIDEKISVKDEEIKNLTKRIACLEYDEEAHFPRDTYSFIALNGPEGTKPWTGEKKSMFLFGFLPFILQMALLVLLNCFIFRREGVVEPTSNIMIVARFVSIVAFSLVPDMSLQDMIDAFRLWPKSDIHRTGRMIACTFRGIQGFTACFSALLLINAAPNVVDIILNFAAVNFVSDYDSIAFDLAQNGVFGPTIQKEADRIYNHDLPDAVAKNETNKHLKYRLAIGLVLVIFCTTEIYFTARPDDKCILYFFMGWDKSTIEEDHGCYALI